MTILLALWLAAVTAYLLWQWYRGRVLTTAVHQRRQRIEALRARHARAEHLLAEMQSPDPEKRVEAARTLIRQRAAAR